MDTETPTTIPADQAYDQKVDLGDELDPKYANSREYTDDDPIYRRDFEAHGGIELAGKYVGDAAYYAKGAAAHVSYARARAVMKQWREAAGVGVFRPNRKGRRGVRTR